MDFLRCYHFYKRGVAVSLPILVLVIILLSQSAPSAPPSPLSWKTLGPGIEYSSPQVAANALKGDGILHIVRIDPSKARLRALMASESGKRQKTARAWCGDYGLTAVINAGMYDLDHLTHVGYMTSKGHINNKKWSKQYNSILAFDPMAPGIAPARVFDGNAPGPELEQYATLIQNLRLIKGDGVNVWQKQFREWSEAALAEDRQGRILFLFIRTPFTMYEFNRMVLSLPLDIVRAMHLEGGPVASLSICSPVLELHLGGSYETGFGEDGGNGVQAALPNVIGVEIIR